MFGKYQQNALFFRPVANYFLFLPPVGNYFISILLTICYARKIKQQIRFDFEISFSNGILVQISSRYRFERWAKNNRTGDIPTVWTAVIIRINL